VSCTDDPDREHAARGRELAVSRPRAVLREIDGVTGCLEALTVDVEEQHRVP
jgi:predicted membrane GTPase involved in stress response